MLPCLLIGAFFKCAIAKTSFEGNKVSQGLQALACRQFGKVGVGGDKDSDLGVALVGLEFLDHAGADVEAGAVDWGFGDVEVQRRASLGGTRSESMMKMERL